MASKAAILSIFVFLAVVSSTGASKALVQVSSLKVADPSYSMCPLCVEFMDNAIDVLLNVILNDDVIGGCAGLCGYLSNQYEGIICNLLCDYVGLDAFIALIEEEDPDSIYNCQVIDACAEIDGGQAQITKVWVTPASGPQGTNFTLGMIYQVIKTTGPGYLSILIIPPASDGGFPFGGDAFVDVTQPGTYGIEFSLVASPSESEDFSPGAYQVSFAVCEGDCSNVHPYGGVYDMKNTTMTITG
jgi:hypothetical protein